MRAARIAPWVVAALTAAVVGCSLVLDALTDSYGDDLWVVAVWLAATVSSSAVGVVLATRCRDNPIGWLLLANGLVVALNGLATTYAEYAVLAHPGALPGGDWAATFNENGWPTLFVCVTAIAFIFPDGRLPSPRWRPVAISAAAAFGVLTVISLFSPERFGEPFETVSSPLPALPEAVYFGLFMISGPAAFASLIAAALAVRARLRRSSGAERQQIRWLAYAAVLIPATVVTCLIDGADGPPTVIALTLTLIAIPVAIGVAVTRYRLYELDRLVNRTLVYALVTVLLAATYAAVSVLLGVAIGAGSTLPTALATLAVALAFRPLRTRIQTLVDRRFNRARYEGLHTVDGFIGRLRAGDAAPEAVGDVLAQALGDPGLELFFSLPGAGGDYVDALGRTVSPPPRSGRVRTPVRRGRLDLAVIVHDPALAERPDVLDSVIEAAGLAIEIARLQAELRVRLAEVEESRARIVTAGYEERRRLERDLHDGAQQRLVSIGLSLRHLQAQLPAADDSVRRSLDDSVAELGGAIEQLRELARGVRPACLDDGLAAALRDLASRSPLRTEVEAPQARFDAQIEAAAYFVASEALTNAAKHARASHVVLSAARDNGHLVLSVRDDGVGGAVAAERSGLAGIADRVAALGGSLSVSDGPDGGTQVIAELPCES